MQSDSEGYFHCADVALCDGCVKDLLDSRAFSSILSYGAGCYDCCHHSADSLECRYWVANDFSGSSSSTSSCCSSTTLAVFQDSIDYCRVAVPDWCSKLHLSLSVCHHPDSSHLC